MHCCVQADEGYDSPPDSPAGRAPIAPLPTLDGGSPMTPRKATRCGLLGPLPGRVADLTRAHRSSRASLLPTLTLTVNLTPTWTPVVANTIQS